jgi:glutathione S-transferase
MAVHYGDKQAECQFDNYDCVALPEGGFDRSSWFDVKPGLKEKNSMMNLPYVVDGPVVISQTNAVLMYLGRKFGLVGSNEQELANVEQVLCQAMDLRNDTVRMAYMSGEVAAHLQSSPAHFEKLEGFLKQIGTPFFGGSTPSVADFHVFEMIEQHQLMAAFAKVDNFFEPFPGLVNLHQAIKDDPKLASYFASEEYGYPQNNKMAKYGGDLNDGR